MGEYEKWGKSISKLEATLILILGSTLIYFLDKVI